MPLWSSVSKICNAKSQSARKMISFEIPWTVSQDISTSILWYASSLQHVEVATHITWQPKELILQVWSQCFSHQSSCSWIFSQPSPCCTCSNFPSCTYSSFYFFLFHVLRTKPIACPTTLGPPIAPPQPFKTEDSVVSFMQLQYL